MVAVKNIKAVSNLKQLFLINYFSTLKVEVISDYQ